MTAPNAGDLAHQVLIDSQPGVGTSIRSSSLGSPAEEGFWLAALRDRAHFVTAPGLYRPRHALSFVLLRSGGSAIVRRFASGGVRALVDRRSTLTTEMALGLDTWPGWSAPSTHLAPVAAADLRAYAEKARTDLRGRASALRGSIVTVVASLLDDWTAPVTIVGFPEPDRVPIIWAVREIGRQQRQRRAAREWAFSTYELSTAEPAGGLPFEVVFLPARPNDADGRRIVDLSRFAAMIAGRQTATSARAVTLVNDLLGPPAESSAVEDRRETSREREPADAATGPISRVTTTERARGRVLRSVRCPTCADTFPWMDDGQVWVYDKGKSEFDVLDVAKWEPVKRADVLRRGYRICPNPSGDTPEHYLPATYAEFADPLVIGLVGLTLAGKTHLLTAMIREAYGGGLQPYGLRTTALDFLRHEAFTREYVEPLTRGDELPGTRDGFIDARDTMLLRGPAGARPVTFFDIAGEELVNLDAHSPASRFLLAVNAVIFVLAPKEDGQAPSSGSSENVAFDQAMERIGTANAASLTADGIPAAIVLTKADQLRYLPPADRWLRRGTEERLDARRIRAESRDVFAYLHQHGSSAALNPFTAFPRCTLHFASASGRDATATADRERRFERGVQPVRVLEPLIAILAMTGVLTGPEAEKVGAP